MLSIDVVCLLHENHEASGRRCLTARPAGPHVPDRELPMMLALGARSAEESTDHVSAAAPFDAVARAELAAEAAGQDDLRRTVATSEQGDAAPADAW